MMTAEINCLITVSSDIKTCTVNRQSVRIAHQNDYEYNEEQIL